MKAVLAIASTTVGEAVRRKVLLIILLIGVLLLSIVPSLSILSARAENSVMIATMYFVLRITSALIAIVLTVYMIPNEIERRTIYTILSKPVQRWQFLVGKYLGAVFTLAIMVALMSVVMLGLFFALKRPPVGELLNIGKQPMLYFMEVSLLAAVAIFFSTFVTPLVNFFITFGVWGVGSVLNPFYDTIADSKTAHPVMQFTAKAINTILPNFANYDVKNPIINPGVVIQNESYYYMITVGYGFIYIMVLLVLGILIFDRREV